MPRELKSKFVKVRCTPEEQLAWQSKAEAQGITIADLLRRGADMPTTGKVVRRKRKEHIVADPALLRQLAAIGNNLNQIARAANAVGFVPADHARLLAYMSAVQRELAALRQVPEVEEDAQ